MEFLPRLAEQRIQEAIENGELDNLPGKGKPLNLNDCCQVPPELRMAYKVLKNSGMLPAEMDIQKEIEVLQQLIATCQDEQQKQALQGKLRDKQLYYNIVMEKRRKR